MYTLSTVVMPLKFIDFSPKLERPCVTKRQIGGALPGRAHTDANQHRQMASPSQKGQITKPDVPLQIDSQKFT